MRAMPTQWSNLTRGEPVFVDLVEEVDLSCSQNFNQIPIPGTTDVLR